MKNHLTSFSIILLLVYLTACASNPSLSTTDVPLPSEEPTPTSEVPSGGEILESLDPHDILVQQDYEPGFFRPEAFYEFGRVPMFSLFADGTVIYILEGATYDQETVMEYKLSPAESLGLLQQVLDYGFEGLESHTDFCQDQEGGEQECVADAATTILRARLPNGELHEVKIYHSFANDPQAFQDITDFLTGYTNADAQPYKPEGASLFIRQLEGVTDVTFQDWPLDPAWLSALDFGDMGLAGVSLTGEDLNTYLDAVPRNTGDVFFSQDGLEYAALLVPWLPGKDYSSEISDAFPLPENSAAPTPEPAVFSACPESTPAQAGVLRLAYLDDGNLWIWDEGTEPTSLTSSADLNQLKLTPNGEMVVFTRQLSGGGSELWAADPMKATTLPLTSESELQGEIQILSFSSDEKMVAFVHYPDKIGGELWAANMDGSGAQRLVSTEDLMKINTEANADSATPAGVTWMPGTYSLTFDAEPTFNNDGIYIFVQSQVWVVDLVSGEQKALLPVGEGGNVSYSPDGKTMMITTPDSLKFLNLVTGEIHQGDLDYFAVGFGEYYAYPTSTWSPDSNTVLIAQPDTESYDIDQPVTIWQVPVDGSPAQILLEVTGFFPIFSFSPDQANVAYWTATASDPNFRQLSITSVDGSEGITYTSNETIDFIGWLPDSRHFLYVLGDQDKAYVGDLCGEPAPLDIDFHPVGIRWLDVSRFLFERPPGGNLELYEAHPDGTTILRLNIEDSGGYDSVILQAE